MKFKTPLSGAVAVLALFLLQSCATMHKSSSASLAGSWTNQYGTVWTIKGDGSFDVDMNHDGRRDAWGTYVVDGDTMRITGTGGVGPKGCQHSTGVYHFTQQGNMLHFTLVKDPCKLRVKNVLKNWHKS